MASLRMSRGPGQMQVMHVGALAHAIVAEPTPAVAPATPPSDTQHSVSLVDIPTFFYGPFDHVANEVSAKPVEVGVVRRFTYVRTSARPTSSR